MATDIVQLLEKLPPVTSYATQDAFERGAKDIPGPATKSTIEKFPAVEGQGSNYLVLSIATVADDLVPWGENVALRDQQLMDFWPTETNLSGAIYGVASRNAAFKWRVTTPEERKPDKNLIKTLTQLIERSDYGRGWMRFILSGTISLLTQDNGWFWELIRPSVRQDPTEKANPVVGIANLDPSRCVRTGNPRWPVIFTDLNGTPHKMPWWSVVTVEDFPSPIGSMHGVQYCAVTRVLRAAQTMRDITIFDREKISGRDPSAIHLVGGVHRQEIDDMRARESEKADNQGRTRYMPPIILTTLDPNATVSHVQIDLKSLPEGFDEDTKLKWYISQIANGFGGDYQDFAPLPAGNLGTSQQSNVLARKSKAKGPALFMGLVSYAVNNYGVLPAKASFVYDDADALDSQEVANLEKTRAETRALRINSGELSSSVAREIAVADGDLTDDQAKEIDDEQEAAKKLAEEQFAQAQSNGGGSQVAGQGTGKTPGGRPTSLTSKPQSPTARRSPKPDRAPGKKTLVEFVEETFGSIKQLPGKVAQLTGAAPSDEEVEMDRKLAEAIVESQQLMAALLKQLASQNQAPPNVTVNPSITVVTPKRTKTVHRDTAGRITSITEE